MAADEAAKLSVAEERAREQMKFQQRAIEVSRKATERAMEILKQPLKGSRPHDAARLLAVGDAIGRAALGLSGATGEIGHFGLRPVAAPNIRVVIHRDAQSDVTDSFKRHPELTRPRNGLEENNETGLATD